MGEYIEAIEIYTSVSELFPQAGQKVDFSKLDTLTQRLNKLPEPGSLSFDIQNLREVLEKLSEIKQIQKDIRQIQETGGAQATAGDLNLELSNYFVQV